MRGKNEILIVIPARYGSTRLPGKPLLSETGKPLIQHVYERAARARLRARIVVATDDERILAAVMKFGGQAVMTSPKCRSGTDRVCEVARTEPKAKLLVNVQGDEPELNPRNIETVVAILEKDDEVGIGTLACPFNDWAEFADPAKVKVLLAQVVHRRIASARRTGDALYFSRAMIPHVAVIPDEPRYGRCMVPPGVYRHLGIYAFRRQALLKFASARETELEKVEKLEQLRALENGMRIRVGIVGYTPAGIDTPEDYDAFVRRFRKTEE